MAKSAKFSLKLLIDEEKYKVVLVEASQDFVDVLFSLLTLPMGTIARLLEKHQQLPPVLGCYMNLNQSVSGMVLDNFWNEACRSMLLYPKSMKEIHCRRLKLIIDDSEPTRIFICPNLENNNGSCRRVYSNFKTMRCSCGKLMNKEIHVPEELQVVEKIGNDVDGVFVSCRSSFIVTDDLQVTMNSIGAVLNTLKGLRYQGLSDMQELILDVGFEEVLTLLGLFFTSDTPLTHAFLRETCITRMHKNITFSPPAPRTEDVKGKRKCDVKLFIRKFDRKIHYAECNEVFIDSLLTFIYLPLELACSLSSDDTILRCVGNLRRSQCRRASTSDVSDVPYYYNCGNSLLYDHIHTSSPPSFGCLFPSDCYSDSVVKFTRPVKKPVTSQDKRYVIVYPHHPIEKPLFVIKSTDPTTIYRGFVKENTRFIVSDDLIITPMNSSSTVGLLKKNKIYINDIKEQLVSISKAEIISILRASLISSSALTNGLSNLLMKKPNEET